MDLKKSLCEYTAIYRRSVEMTGVLEKRVTLQSPTNGDYPLDALMSDCCLVLVAEDLSF